MPRFKAYNYDQNAMVVINYQDKLQPGTFEHDVHYLMEHKIDLSVSIPSSTTTRPDGVCCNVVNTGACRTQARPTIAMALDDKYLLLSITSAYPITLTG